MDDLRFPIGKYKSQNEVSEDMYQTWLKTIDSFHDQLRKAVSGLNEEQLNATYRANSWTIKQLIHHLADSHMNAYMRFKLALTEDNPTIKPYFEASWATLEDYSGSIAPSMKIIEGVHQRWIKLLSSMSATEYKRTYVHPEFNDVFDLREAVCQYDWHCRHHLAHINIAKKQF